MKDLPTMTRLALAAALLLAATPAFAQTSQGWQQYAPGNSNWEQYVPGNRPMPRMQDVDARGCRPVFIPGQGYQTQCGY